MAKSRDATLDFLASELWKKAYFSKIELDFSNEHNGKLIAQKLYKDLENFKLYVAKHRLTGFYFKLYRYMLNVSLLLDNNKVILKRKLSHKVKTSHNKLCRRYSLTFPNRTFQNEIFS